MIGKRTINPYTYVSLLLNPFLSLNLTIPKVIAKENEKEAGWGWIGAKTDLLRSDIY